jgi:hypothetical protein
MYRPGLLRFRFKRATHQIVLSWQDAHGHGDIEYALQRPAKRDV